MIENKWLLVRSGVWIKNNRYSDFRIWTTVRILYEGHFLYDMFLFRKDHLREDVESSVFNLIVKYKVKEELKNVGQL
jgi:hypothetical protein